MLAGKNMIKKINMLIGDNKRMNKSKNKHLEDLIKEKRSHLRNFKSEIRRKV